MKMSKTKCWYITHIYSCPVCYFQYKSKARAHKKPTQSIKTTTVTNMGAYNN